MRVALVSEFFYPTLGGIQDHLFFFSREMMKRGHEVSIVTPRVLNAGEFHNWWPKDLPKKCYEPVGWSLPFFINGSLGRTAVGLGMKSKLRRLLRPKNFDIVHLHSPLNGTLPILAMAASSVPVVGTFHTSFSESKSMQYLKGLAQKQIDGLDCVLAVSAIALKSIRAFLDLEARIVTNGVDTTYFHPLDEGPDDRIKEFTDGKVNVFFIGRPEPRNGLDCLIRAFHRAHQRCPQTRLIIAGDGEYMYIYRDLVKSLWPGKAPVEFLGSVREERPQIYRSSHIQVFGVEVASFAITVLEGMATGLPVITTNWEGNEVLGRAGEHFLTTPFNDDRALEEKLVELINDEGKRRAFGQRARQQALKFDWKRITDQVLSVYDEVLAANA